MWQHYFHAESLDEAIDLLHQYNSSARVIAGGTDLVLEYRNGVRKDTTVLIDISRIPGLGKIWQDAQNRIHLDAMVAHSDCVRSKLLHKCARPLVEACWSVGSPQIRNRGTVVGNLVTASPANDTITPLMAMSAEVIVQSVRGKRNISLQDFYRGVRKTVLESDEMVVEVVFPALQENQKGVFIKHALRNSQAISLLNCAVILTFDEEVIRDCAITLGAVAPTIIHATKCETYLQQKVLDTAIIQEVGNLVQTEVTPIGDIRSSLVYRKAMAGVVVKRALTALNNGEPSVVPEEPVVLWGNAENPLHSRTISSPDSGESVINVNVNGRRYEVAGAYQKTLLQLLRDDIGLIGSKEGCAEGECGACTVYLDGAAVLACLIPAPRAHGAEVITIEALAADGELNSVQQAFIEEGAVQCGYCTPGFIMSATKLLEEKSAPTRDEIKIGISGNLCRCTGYYKIVDAIEKASRR